MLGTTGANSHLTKGARKAILWPRRTGKKLPETLAEIRQDWAKSEPIQLKFQREARFWRINDVRRCGTPKPVQLLCQAMLTHEYTYAYPAVEVKSGELDSLILPYVNTDCMQLFLDEVGARHPNDKIIMVLDGAGWHSSGLLKPPQNMKLLPLCHPMPLSSIQSNLCGTNCVRTTSIIFSSIVFVVV